MVVDDDRELRELLQEYLSKAGFNIVVASEGNEMRRLLIDQSPDLIILDVMMPGDDGFTLCKHIRKTSYVPIIMLTAASNESDKVIGLEFGADDYMAKPFSPRELLARIKAQLRRSDFKDKTNNRYIVFNNWQLDTEARRLTNTDSGRTIVLPANEYALLVLFLENPKKTLSRDDISSFTYGRDSLPTERGIDVMLSRLRSRLGDDGRNPELIKTIRGAGYVMTANVAHVN